MKKGIIAITALLISVLLIVTGVAVFANDVVNTSTEVKNEVVSVVIEQNEIVQTGSESDLQKIAVVWEKDVSKISNVRLVYSDSNAQEYEIGESDRTDNSILFEKSFSNEAAGDYSLVGIKYNIEGKEEEQEQFLTFDELSIDAEFSVIEQIEAGADSKQVTSISSTDEGAVSEAVENVLTTAAVPKLATTNSKIVITLDPGHNGQTSGPRADSGTSHYGLRENVLNWKIAQACKAELEEYGVIVLLTRNEYDAAYKSESSTSSATELQARADVAINSNSNLFVSLHNNAYDGSARGFEIYYPYNCSYNYNAHTVGYGAASYIESELKALGLVDRGLKIKIDDGSTDNDPSYYAAGVYGDYYGVIRRCRLGGIPAILVEHAFVDNAEDAALLANDEFLKKIGIADATGIAKYFGLSKKVPEPIIEPAVDEELVAPETGDITSSEYTIGKYITGVDRKTSYETLKEKLTAGNGLTFKAVNKDGEELTDSSIIGTGTKINIYNGNDVKASILVCIRGDLNGDGLALASDAILTLKSAIGLYNSNSVQIAAVDINGNGKPEAADAIRILKYASNLDTLDEETPTKGGESDLTSIAGTSLTNRDQLVRYFNAKASNGYPDYYKSTDAPSIEAFCQIYMEEAAAEGIRAEVAFAQAMKETGWLKYGGQVLREQKNFAGLGATDGGARGASFDTVRQGIRAQIQHLKAYANKDALVNDCVDPRFNLVSPRGCATYVEWLGQKENPSGKGWATDQNYGYSIVNMMKSLLSM